MNTTRKACCFRALTIIVGILIWLFGAAVLGFSLYMRFDYWMNNYVKASDELTKYNISVYVLIATGACVILFCFVGIYGAARPDKIALIVYLVFIVLTTLLMIAAGTLATIYSDDIESTVHSSKLLVGIVTKRYGVEERQTYTMDFIQRELKCCGGINFEDYKRSDWSDQNVDQYHMNKVPLSCCSASNDKNVCSMYQDETNLDLNTGLYKTGCGEAIVNFFQNNIGIAAAIAFSIVALMILAIIFAVCLLCYLRKSPLPREDDVVYEMARTQEKSPYPARGGPYANLYQS